MTDEMAKEKVEPKNQPMKPGEIAHNPSNSYLNIN